ncbi:hypothetical protein A3D03_00135 [Candidatus Gottesmanbacteria bacterium RIFCSPHIGHO2_02_FULL_40_13]|uniref:Homing endonuclease LAGLIDADG domain-containing protein n=1 Tax=Candidatus Gottesmanbacteria bacterium RIFCSPHIGHO2_02_FULL_40_13 TaxID=1798384 RepID=A0A1F6A845_9BACT|nr:MAG: hypothetical protein A3D03_00135 [Candidatus Gottesmanbacteria bacterium RIFCSPHIGHO2_02_FULL_40_13]
MTKRQNELIVGKLLGNGSLEDRGNANSRLQIRHSINQKEYVDWCYRQLKEFTCSNPKQHKEPYYFRTKSLPLFSRLRKIWYNNKKKILPINLNLSPFSLAIWYMDDGYYDRIRKSIWICTHCFNMGDLTFLQNLLFRMKIHTGKVKDRTHYKLRVISKDTKEFIRLVRPYIVPSLLYKIGIAP